MGRNPLKFGRRKSSTSALEEALTPTTPAVSSFRVIERPDKINLNGERSAPPGGVRPVTRPFNSPLANLKGRSAEELGVGINRDSGGTTGSGSSGHYESSAASARHSSSSTLPSSVDAERDQDDEELFPRKAKTTPLYQNLSMDESESPLPPSSFSSRAARAFSFGNRNNKPPPHLSDVPLPPVPPKNAARSESPKRERAMTTSSYASTAKPEVPLNLTTPDFGSEFGSMFDRPKSGERFHGPLPPVPPVAAFHRTDSEPMFPARAHSRDVFRSSPEISKDVSGSPYAWDHNGSRERLMSYSPLGSPTLDGPPAPPPHRSNVAAAFLGKSTNGYSTVPERYSSPGPESPSQDAPLSYLAGQILEKDDDDYGNQDESSENPWNTRINLQDPPRPIPNKNSNTELSKVQTRMPSGHPSQASAGASRSVAQTPYSSEEGDSFFTSESRNSTPRAAKIAMVQQEDDSLFDSSPQGPPSRAIMPQHSRGDSSTPKKMTKAQFERLQRRGEGSADQSEEEEEEQRELDEYDDEDDTNRARQMSQQRQKQEANMSVYRQQMKKVTGGGPTDLPSNVVRPSLDRSSLSAPAVPGGIHLGGIGGKPPADAPRMRQGDDDDEDVPLGILQAHGFPSSSRPPTRTGDNDGAQPRRMSTAGSVVGASAGGSLPAFARRLPVDPFYGSSVVNQSNREAMGMSGTPSVYGGGPSMFPMPQMMSQPTAPQMGHPGGLVGVIAGEERAKASRRGSPNAATGAFGASHSQLAMNMPQMGGMPGMMPPRSMSMGNVLPPQAYTPSGMPANPMMGMPMMPQMMPNGQQDQMQQFMQMQMQVMQNMLSMQQQQLGQTPPQQPQTQDYLSVPGHQKQLSTSTASKAPSIRTQSGNQGRAMTMTHPPTRWDLPQQGPRPNSAMPQTYAPSGIHMTNGTPAGYQASIAPSERSNIGMPSRYRPVTMGTDASGRTNSMSSLTKIQAYGNKTPSPDPFQAQNQRQSKLTIRAVDKPKGATKVMTKTVPVDEDDDEGWAEMKKKREDKKKFRWGRKEKDVSLEELVQNLN